MAKPKRVYKRPGVATQKSIEGAKVKGVNYRLPPSDVSHTARRVGKINSVERVNLPSTGAFRGMPSRFRSALVKTMVRENPVARKIREGTGSVRDIFAVTGNFKPEQKLRRKGINLNANISTLPENQRWEVFNEVSQNFEVTIKDPVVRAVYVEALKEGLKL